MPETEQALVPTNGQERAPGPARPTVIRPLETAQEIADAWKQFEELKAEIWTDSDYQTIGKGADAKRYPKKSAWRKIAAAFGIDGVVVHEERRDLKGDGFVWEITVRATAPNGRMMDGTGSCASNERGFSHLHHDVRATAETRAKNRAIADLVGGGEVSAEEIDSTPALSEAEEKFWTSLHTALNVNRTRESHITRLLALIDKGVQAEKAEKAAASPAAASPFENTNPEPEAF